MTTMATHDELEAERKAQKYYWGVLILATIASITGNVVHALLATADHTSTAIPAVAATLAVVPPVVEVLAAYGVHLLVHVRKVGIAYGTAFAITVALVILAFIVSFEALRDLAIVYGGMKPHTAWIIPVVIDFSITGSTVSLLAISQAQRSAVKDSEPEITAEQPITTYTADAAETLNPAESAAGAPEHSPEIDPELDWEPELDDETSLEEELDLVDEAEPTEAIPVPTLAISPATDTVTSADPNEFWVGELDNAQLVVNEGITRIGRTKTAKVLHFHRGGMVPGAIAREAGVNYHTVVRILAFDAAQQVPA